MKRRSILIAIFAVPFEMVHAGERDRLPTPEERAAAAATALEIAKTIDKSPLSEYELNQLYEASGFALKGRYKQRGIGDRISSIRKHHGPIESRIYTNFWGVYTNMPNLPPGDYLIVGFHTKFVGDVNTYSEQITLEKDRNGGSDWHFVEYYIEAAAAG